MLQDFVNDFPFLKFFCFYDNATKQVISIYILISVNDKNVSFVADSTYCKMHAL